MASGAKELSFKFYLILIPFFFFVFLSFLGPLVLHVEVPRLGVQSEPLPLAYT